MIDRPESAKLQPMTPKHTDLAARNFPTAEEEASALRPTSRYEGPDSS